MIEFKNTHFNFIEHTPLIENLNLILDDGGIHTLIGPSGCGKTTLMYLAAGLYVPVSGRVLINGKAAAPGNKKTAVILQDHGLFPWKTVFENIALGLRIRKYSKPELYSRVAETIDYIGLSDAQRKYPAQLSGGERQRLAIGRALVLEPDVLLLDEPFSSLDAMTRERLQNMLIQLKEQIKKVSNREITVLLVTHSIEEAVFVSDRVHIMNECSKIISVPNVSGYPGYRKTEEYFSYCVNLRELMESHQIKEEIQP